MSAVQDPGLFQALDYELDDRIVADTPQRMKALGEPVRMLVLDLVLERAMSVTELAERIGRARGTIAHHVDVLVAAGLLKVVRTRKVRAVTERFYGRTAQTVVMTHSPEGDLPFFAEARAEADWDRLRDESSGGGFTMRHARIPDERASEFVARLHALALEFSRLPREGDREFALLAAVFPTTRPVSPRRKDEP
ncbi:MAG: ArsR/SmtB family transcription factor [Acidimicrobiia bacterium]